MQPFEPVNKVATGKVSMVEYAGTSFCLYLFIHEQSRPEVRILETINDRTGGAFMLFQKMAFLGIQPDVISFNAAITACSRQSQWQVALDAWLRRLWTLIGL